MTKARQKGVRKVNEMKIKACEKIWGPLRVHRMNWKVRLRVLTGWRPKNDEERTKNSWKSSRNHPRKRYGSASVWILFTEPIFFTNFKWFSNYGEGWTIFLFTSPLIYRKMGEMLATQLAQASSARPSELGCFLQKQLPSGGIFWKAQVGLVAICTPIFTKYTPYLFLVILFL